MSMKRRIQEKTQKRSAPAALVKFGGPGAQRLRLDPRRLEQVGELYRLLEF
jgi:hypothetical protein